jgi:hypothetical protein
MKISLKQILAVGALTVASTAAFADGALPSTGNGGLMLVVWDQTTGLSYTRDLQINVDDVATQSAVIGDTYSGAGDLSFNIPATINLSADANLSSFLSTALGANDNVTWGVVGGGVIGTGNGVAVKRYLTTTSADLVSGNSAVTNGKLTTSWSGLESRQVYLNQSIEQTNGTSVNGDGKSNNPSLFSANWDDAAGTWSASGVNNQVALDSKANFYLVTSAGGGSGTLARIYTLAGLTLSSTGLLTSDVVGTGATPIPAAIWLLGSGLAGLVGIGRRKAA